MTNEWIQKELEEMPTREEYIKIPALKFEENKPKIIIINCDKPFETWTSNDGKNTIKKMIPVIDNGVQKMWWLNPANPSYKALLQMLMTGKNTITVLQTGAQAQTKYVLL